MAIPAFDILSIASGGGGLDRAVELAAPGSRVICHVEREAFAASVLAGAMEAGDMAPAPVWSDARTFDGRRWRGCVDLVTAGIPCQGYSLAGKRRLQHDERDLWDDTLRIVEESGAGWLLVENVRGLLIPGADVGAGITRILGELGSRGWDAEWLGLRASDVGASHGRFRVFILAHRRRDGGAGRGGRGELDGAACGAEGEAWERQWMRDASGDGGKTVADAECAAPPRLREHGGEVHAWTPAARPGASGACLADAGIERSQGIGAAGAAPRATGRSSRADLPHFAPGPTDPRWADILARYPDLAPATEPTVRGVADGLAANRRDWLRALGNGVVEVQGAVAFRVLFERLVGEGGVSDDA